MVETPDNIMNRRMSEAHVEMRKVEEIYMYLIEEAAKSLIRMEKSQTQSLRLRFSKGV